MRRRRRAPLNTIMQTGAQESPALPFPAPACRRYRRDRLDEIDKAVIMRTARGGFRADDERPAGRSILGPWPPDELSQQRVADSAGQFREFFLNPVNKWDRLRLI